ncbi:hypothetical protein ALQ37_102606 [Pseudomonas syringae pv. aptata]|uniref:Uncharacterized protein n=1 Tax=Pseudomonas syringae pv. aptata TaxID=83167 RepID=A0A0Q0CE92_PSEAP|nr:hypothetical protein ALO85_101875 [Pseudomonas syringae pv. aptata]RMO70978.1 hypothetical protein ALQ37_102606 [Pseudomonas syringae pv. aptata]
MRFIRMMTREYRDQGKMRAVHTAPFFVCRKAYPTKKALLGAFCLRGI